MLRSCLKISPMVEEIKSIFKPLENGCDAVLFGSAVTGGMRPSSDIDITVITYIRDKEKNKKIQYELFGLLPKKYDIRVFELFPIHIQYSIVQNYQVIYGDPLEISEYFYSFRKKWEDCRRRILNNQFKSYQERLSLIK